MIRRTSLYATLLAGWAGLVAGCGPEPTDAVGLLEDLADTTVNADQLPRPLIQSDPLGGELPLTARFTINAPNTTEFGGTLLWDLGDGSTATGFETTHTYDAPGIYTVTVGNNDILSDPLRFPVIPDLDMELDPNGTVGEIPWTISFRAVTVDPSHALPDAAYDWRLNGRVIAEGIEGNVTIREVGDYTLGLFVTIAGVTIPCAERNLAAGMISDTNNAPVLVAYAGEDRSVAPGTLVTLDAGGSSSSTGNSLAYEWVQQSGPDVSLVFANGERANFQAPNAGTLTFGLTVRDGEFTASDTVQIEVKRDADGGVLAIENNAGLLSTGQEGGPFSPDTMTYKLTNVGSNNLNWRGLTNADWLTLSTTSGSLAAEESVNVVVNISSSAATLAPGTYSDVVRFENLSNGEGTSNRQFALTVTPNPNHLGVQPAAEQVVSGNKGGPFAPQTFDYTVENTGSQPLDWSVTRSASWLTLSRASGTLAPGSTETVTATINNNATGLLPGDYSNEVTFLNETEDSELIRTVLLTVATPAGRLAVSPGGGVTSSGPQGGPFAPNTHSFTLRNTGGDTLNWSARKDSLWLVLAPASGTLAPGETATVNASTSVIATVLEAGQHDDVITFTNETNGNGTTTRGFTLDISPASGALQVSPSSGLASSGDVGGPFTPASRAFTLTNSGGEALTWQASKTASWLNLSATSGSLAPGATATVIASLNGGANGLTAGSYSDTISFLNMSTGVGSTTRPVVLSVSEPASLAVSPADGLTSSGDPGGPFTPSTKTYTLLNNGGAPLTYQVSKTQPWISLSKTSGTLQPGASNTVTVTLNGNANALGSANYSDSVVFANLTNGNGDAVRGVNLTVNDPPGELSVTPGSGMTTSGAVGGPFNPVGKQYTLQNGGGSTLNWSASASQTWLTVTPSSGAIAPGGSTVVTVSVNNNADGLAAGSYNGQVDFSNDMNSSGNTSRQVTLTVQNPPALAVTAAGPLSSSGLTGGPFSPNSRTYTLQNTGDMPLNFSVTKNVGWVTLSQSAGTLAGGASTTVTVSLNSNANALAAGTHNDTVSFTNSTNAAGNTTRGVNLTVSSPAALAITPADGLTSTGLAGGPFSPSSKTFTISNTGDQNLTWSASKSRNWVSLSQTGGTLASGASTTVVATLNANALSLPVGTHTDSVSLVNVTNGTGSGSRAINLTVQNAATLSVSANGSGNSSGGEGGPFTPASHSYTLTNDGDLPLNWTAGDNVNWLQCNPLSGTLGAGDSTTVTVNLLSAADSLSAGNYNGTLNFTNATNGQGSTSRNVALAVTGNCETSNGTFTNYAMTSQSGAFVAEFDVTPSANGMDGLVMFSEGQTAGWTDLAAAARFNVSGSIDARNGDSYTADNTINYAAGQTYHFRMLINVVTHTYSIYVTPPGGSEQIVGQDFDFRTDKQNITAINHWSLYSGGGTLDVCNMNFSVGANQPPVVNAGSDTSTAMPSASVSLDATVVDDGLPSNPGVVSTTWSKLSGPGNVTFGNASAVDTSASFDADGTYVLRLTATDGALTTTDDVTVTVAPPPPPSLVVSTNSLNFSASDNALTFTVSNGGSGTLSYNISDNASWLSVSPNSGSSTGENDTITASVNRSGLSDGVHNATITVTPDTGSAQTVAVSLQVGSAGVAMNAAHRTSGVAPLPVFFSALESSSNIVQPPLVGGRREYNDYHYRWSFGDPGSGNWAVSGSSRNEAFGHIAHHTFENAGTYTVNLTVTAPDGSVTSYTQDITVSAFSGTTYYVASNGNDSNAGTSQGAPLRSFGAAMNKLAPNVRVLFRRGDTFSANGGTTISTLGPTIIGAYGSGTNPDSRGIFANNPVLTSNSDIFRIARNTEQRHLKIMDLELAGTNNNDQIAINGGAGTQRGWLMLRLKIHNFGYPILTNGWYGSSSTPDPATMHQYTFVQDCEIYDSNKWMIFMGGTKMAIMGNHVYNSTVSHVTRLWFADKTIYAHNDVHDSGNGLHCLKMHNDSNGNDIWTGTNAIVSDNRFQSGGVWPVAIGPQDSGRDERLHGLLFERNTCLSDGDTLTAVALWVSHATVRNNIFDGTGAQPWFVGLNISQRGSEPAPVNNRVLNNTFYRNGNSSEFTGVTISSSGSEVKNNLFIPGNAGTQVGLGSNPSGMSASNNLLTNSPGLGNPAGGDFMPTNGSPVINAGTDAGVMFDYFNLPRNGGHDVGAFEFQG